MDPISLIVAAVGVGAAAALKDTTGAAIKDAYSGLKALLRHRFKGDDAIVERAEGQPSTLEPHLVAVGAAHDEELLRAAQEVLLQVDPSGARLGKYNVTVSGGKGVVIGDNATVHQAFDA